MILVCLFVCVFVLLKVLEESFQSLIYRHSISFFFFLISRCHVSLYSIWGDKLRRHSGNINRPTNRWWWISLADEDEEPRCVQLTNQHKGAIRFIRKVNSYLFQIFSLPPLLWRLLWEESSEISSLFVYRRCYLFFPSLQVLVLLLLIIILFDIFFCLIFWIKFSSPPRLPYASFSLISSISLEDDDELGCIGVSYLSSWYLAIWRKIWKNWIFRAHFFLHFALNIIFILTLLPLFCNPKWSLSHFIKAFDDFTKFWVFPSPE